MQSQTWSCGAGSFKAVLGYYGLSAVEANLIEMLNTTPSHGTYPWDMPSNPISSRRSST